MSIEKHKHVPVKDKVPEATKEFEKLIGQRFTESQVFLDGSWHFYFGEVSDGISRPYLAVECCWRFTKGEQILIGVEDYDSLEKSTHRQMEALRNLVGSAGLGVETVSIDAWGGFRITFVDGYALDVFPASDREMEWMLKNPKWGSLVLMDGILYKAEGDGDGESPA